MHLPFFSRWIKNRKYSILHFIDHGVVVHTDLDIPTPYSISVCWSLWKRYRSYREWLSSNEKERKDILSRKI
jgi:hypothetical protein